MIHTCTKHEPGRACYHHGCRCRDCTDAATRYAKRMKAGHVQRVPADLVRTHVLRLRASGMTVTAIANAASVATATVTRVSRGDHPSVRQDVARRILTVRPRPVADVRQGKVDGCGTRLRLRALHAIGWDWFALGEQLGAAPTAVQKWANADRVYAQVRARVADTYDRLWDQPRDTFGGRRATIRAARRGWLPPMALDDDRLDTPGYRPRMPRTTARPWGATRENVAELSAQGLTDEGIAHRLGITVNAVQTARRRAA